MLLVHGSSANGASGGDGGVCGGLGGHKGGSGLGDGGLGDGGGGEGEGGGGEGSSGTEDSIVMVGAPSTVMPSALDAFSAVSRVERSKACTAVARVAAGTATLAVMITLPAATRIVTSGLSTPAAAATFCCKLDLSLSE